MTLYTIIATTAALGADQAELDVHVDEFTNQDEVIGYARRMAEEMFGMAQQLNLDLEYSNVSLFAGEETDAPFDPESEAFLGMWFFTDDGAGYVTAEEFREADTDETN